jgi:hypothetical protein
MTRFHTCCTALKLRWRHQEWQYGKEGIQRAYGFFFQTHAGKDGYCGFWSYLESEGRWKGGWVWKKPTRLRWTSGSIGMRRRTRQDEAGDLFFPSFSVLCRSSLLICKGDPHPGTCAQRTLRAEDFQCLGLHAGAAAGCPYLDTPSR